MSLTFRRATAADAVALCVFVNAAYRGESSRAGWTTEADLLDGQRIDPDGLRSLLGEPGVSVVVAEQNGTLVGCFELSDDPDGTGEGYVGMITVDPAAQGGGLGKALLAEAERRCIARGQRAMRMWVIRQRESLIAFYARRGYVDTGERRPFPYGQPQFGLPRRDDLEFLVLRKELPPDADAARARQSG